MKAVGKKQRNRRSLMKKSCAIYATLLTKMLNSYLVDIKHAKSVFKFILKIGKLH
jgi:hypothetical protein